MLFEIVWLVRQGDLAPKFVEGDAVEEGGHLNDQTLAEPHEPRIGVLVGLPVTPFALPIPKDDHGGAVGIDSAHGYRPERLRKAGYEGPQHLPDKLFLAVEGLRYL